MMSSVGTSSPPALTPERAQEALRDFALQLEQSAAGIRQAGLDVPASLDRRIDNAVRRIPLRPEVPIALVGGTGSGKSTLVNALLAAYVLPISSTWACTSAVTEIAWSDTGYYAANVELISRSEWLEELDLLEHDLADARQLGGDHLGASKAAEDKIKAIYGEASVTRYLASLDRSELVEPEPIRMAFDRGRLIVEAEEVGWFREQLATYLTSGHRYWPIVRRARIEGPFEILREGAVLVDLPGLNDPNQAREATTRAYLRSARFVWVVFKMDRAITRDVFELLGERGGLLRRLYMDGRASSLRLVGTGSDAITPQSDIPAFGLPADADDRDIVLARAEAVRGHVRDQLDELAQLVGRDAQAEPQQIAQLRADLARAPIHCVSAVDYQKCIGLDRPLRQVLTSAEDTGIPELQQETLRLLEKSGQRAHLELVNEELWSVRDELEQLIGATATRLRAHQQLDGRQRNEVAEMAEPAARALDGRATKAVERFEAAMAKAAEILRQRLDGAGADAERDVAELEPIWRTMHLSTMRAVVRRGGTWADRERTIDLNRQIARPLLDRIPFAWAEFFGHRAVVALESLTGDLEQAMDEFLEQFRSSLGRQPAYDGELNRTGTAAIDAARHLVESRLRGMQQEMTERLERDRRQIDEEIRDAVRRRMAPAYEAMLAMTGTGARARMVDLLADASKETSHGMHGDLTAMVTELLGALMIDLRGDAAAAAGQIRTEGEALLSTVSPRNPSQPSNADGAVQLNELDRLLDDLPELTVES